MMDARRAAAREAVLTGALAAARRGWRVFPVGGRNGPKAPRDGWLWADRNTTDPATVRRWLTGTTAYGIACGPSRLVVIDLDVDLRPEDGGEAAFAALCDRAGEPWPVTFTVRTPSGGLHLYFRASPDHKITVSTGQVAPRIDVRGAGGYVVGPLSVIAGREYRLRGSVRALASLPAWLSALCVPRPAPAPVPWAGPPASDAYAQAALDGEAVLVAAAPEGCRNDQLNRSAHALARFPDRELQAGAILAVLGAAAQRAGLREPEIGRTIRSALRARRRS
jgi:hypothetical protein